MASPLPGRGAVDLGNGMAGSFMDDGSVQIWRIDSGQLVANVQAGDFSYDLGTGQAATMGANGQFSVYDIGGQPNAGGFPGYTSGGGAAGGSGGGAPTTLAGTAGGTSGAGAAGAGGSLLSRYPWLAGAAAAYPQNLSVLTNPTQQKALAPGYIPGSSTYNQYNLASGNLFGNINGVLSNLNYGVGGPGDPTTGKEPQTPQEWLNGPKAFGWYGNMGTAETGTQGLDYIATLFGRPDAGRSGISTAAWSAPDQYWASLAQLVQQGKVKASAFGLKALAAKGYTVTPPGGAANLEAEFGANQGAAGAGGAGGAGGQGGAGGASSADQALSDYLASIQANAQALQAAELAYRDWQMRTGDDQMAFAHAQQEYENKRNEILFEYSKQKDQWALQQSAGYFDINGQRTPTLAGIAQEANLTGQYQGKPTFQREQYESGVTQNLLSLQAGLRGPQNYGQYLKVLGSTPQGMRDVVNSAAGRFTMPTTTGQTGSTQSADVQSLLNDVRTGAPNAQAEWQSALSGGLPAPNQINLANWSRMLPSQQGLLQSAYESQGWDVNDFTKMLQQSAPKGTGAQAGSFRF